MTEQMNIAFTKQNLAEMKEVTMYHILVKRKGEFEEKLQNVMKKCDELKCTIDTLISKEQKLRILKKRAEMCLKLNLEYYANLEKQLITEKEKNAEIYIQYEEAIKKHQEIFKKRLEYYKQNPLAGEYQKEAAKVNGVKIQIKIIQQAIKEQKRKNRQLCEIQKQIFQAFIINLAKSCVEKRKSQCLLQEVEFKKERLMEKVFELNKKKKLLDEKKEKFKINTSYSSTKKIAFSTNDSLEISENVISNNNLNQMTKIKSTIDIQNQIRENRFGIALRSQDPNFIEMLKSRENARKTNENLIPLKSIRNAFDGTKVHNAANEKQNMKPQTLKFDNEMKPSSPKKPKILKPIIKTHKSKVEPKMIPPTDDQTVNKVSTTSSENVISTNVSVTNYTTPNVMKGQGILKAKIMNVEIVKSADIDFNIQENSDRNDLKQNDPESLSYCKTVVEEKNSAIEERIATPYPNPGDSSEYSDEPASLTTNQNMNDSKSEISSSIPTQENSLPMNTDNVVFHSPNEPNASSNSFSAFDFQDFGNAESSSTNDDEPKNLITVENEKKTSVFRLFHDHNESEGKRKKNEINIGFGQKSSAPKKKSSGFFFNMI